MITQIEFISKVNNKITLRLISLPDKIELLAKQMKKIIRSPLTNDDNFIEVTLSSSNIAAFLEALEQHQLIKLSITSAFKQKFVNLSLDNLEKETDNVKPLVDKLVQKGSHENANAEQKEKAAQYVTLMKKFSDIQLMLRELSSSILTSLPSSPHNADDFNNIKKKLAPFIKMLPHFPTQATKLLYNVTAFPLDTDEQIINLINSVFADIPLSKDEKELLFNELNEIHNYSRKNSEQLSLNYNLDQQPWLIAQMVRDAGIVLILEAQELIKNQAIETALAKQKLEYELAIETALAKQKQEHELAIETALAKQRQQHEFVLHAFEKTIAETRTEKDFGRFQYNRGNANSKPFNRFLAVSLFTTVGLFRSSSANLSVPLLNNNTDGDKKAAEQGSDAITNAEQHRKYIIDGTI